MKGAPTNQRGEESASGMGQKLNSTTLSTVKSEFENDAAKRDAPNKRKMEVYALGMEQHGQRRHVLLRDAPTKS